MRRHESHHPTPLTRLAAGLASPAGFTLIEIMATALIVILIAAGVAQGLVSGAHLSGYEQHRSQANALAEQDQERLRSLSAKQLVGLSTPQTFTVALNGTTYTVSSQATLESTTASVPCATSGSNAAAYFHTVSTVSWTDVSGGSQSVSEEGLVTPARSGTLLVKTVDQTLTNPVSGATVSVTGSTTGDAESGTTDANGCIVFTGLAIDTYSVTASYPGDMTVNDTAAVTASGTSRPTNGVEVLAAPGAINASLVTNAYTTDTGTTVGTITGQLSPEITYTGGGSYSSMASPTTTTPGTPTSSFSLSNLFPYPFSGPPVNYTNNYRLWAGKCQQEQPPSTIDATSVNPGSTATMQSLMPALALYTTYGGTNVIPAHVKVTFTSTSGTACTETWNETTRGTSGLIGTMPTNGVLQYPGIPFASNVTSGANASASGQTGTINVCADYNNHYSDYAGPNYVTLPLSFTAPTVMNLAIKSQGFAGGTC